MSNRLPRERAAWRLNPPSRRHHTLMRGLPQGRPPGLTPLHHVVLTTHLL